MREYVIANVKPLQCYYTKNNYDRIFFILS